MRLWTDDAIAAPFSYWLPGGAHVVLPAYLLERPATIPHGACARAAASPPARYLWLYFFRVLSWLCLLNPFAHLWNLRLGRMQEFACDEAADHAPRLVA